MPRNQRKQGNVARRPTSKTVARQSVLGSADTRARGWCFTINNPIGLDGYTGHLHGNLVEQQITEDQVFSHVEIAPLQKASSYLITQLEIGDNGTLHFQGYVYLEGRGKTLSAIKSLSPRAHFEIAKGTPADNTKYCSKREGRIAGPFKSGKPPQQGKRSDLETVAQEVLDGACIRTVACSHPSTYIRYHKGISALQFACDAGRPREDVMVVFIFGPTGVGKTTEIEASFPDYYPKMKCKQGSEEWFDGYFGQEVIIWDEFYGQCPWSTMLKLADKTPLALPIKGNFVWCRAKFVIFISNSKPQDVYKWIWENEPNKMAAWVRRILCFEVYAFGKSRFYDFRQEFLDTVRKGAGGLAKSAPDPAESYNLGVQKISPWTWYMQSRERDLLWEHPDDPI